MPMASPLREAVALVDGKGADGGHGGGEGGEGSEGGHGGGEGGGAANAQVNSRQSSMQLNGKKVSVIRRAPGIHATPSVIATARSGQFPGAYRACRSATE